MRITDYFNELLDREPLGSLLLIRNRMVPYVMGDDAVFKALADKSRRRLLDKLRERNGQTLGDLCQGMRMTRQAVAKHLRVLKKANLVSFRREGRERFHFINPVPVHEIAQRWISKFEQPHLEALSDLKKRMEKPNG